LLLISSHLKNYTISQKTYILKDKITTRFKAGKRRLHICFLMEKVYFCSSGILVICPQLGRNKKQVAIKDENRFTANTTLKIV